MMREDLDMDQDFIGKKAGLYSIMKLIDLN